MPTYYKYANREADSYVNWAEIGKNMSDMLANENKVREEKKAAIDKASREFGEILANAPQGESKQMNEWALKFGGDAQAARLMQDKLLKSGQLKLNDYLIMRQNTTDGTTNAFNLVKEYQEEFKTKWDRMKEDKSQDLEQFLMAEAEGFGNFTQTQLYINPTDGKVNVAYKEKDANGVYVMSKNPNKFTDINSLRSRIKGQFDKYDVDANMKVYVDGLGDHISAFVSAKNSLSSTGTITEVLNVMEKENLPTDPKKLQEYKDKLKVEYDAATKAKKNPYKGTFEQYFQEKGSLKKATMDFIDAETKMLQSQLANGYNTSSILTNSINIAPNGKEYSFTWDEKEAADKPEKILLKNKSNGNPEPVFSKEQQSAALEYLRLQARMRYDEKEKVESTAQLRDESYHPQQFAPQQWQNDEEKLRQQGDIIAKNMALLTTGNPAESSNAAKFLASQGLNISKSGSKISYTNKDGKTVTFDMNGMPQDKVMTTLVGVIPTEWGIAPEGIVRKANSYMSGKSLNLTSSAQGYAPEAPKRDVYNEFNNQVSRRFTASMFNDQKSTSTGPKIQSMLAGIPGINVTYSGTGSWYNDITVTYEGGGQKKSVQLNSNENASAASAQLAKLQNFLNSLPDDAKSRVLGPSTQAP